MKIPVKVTPQTLGWAGALTTTVGIATTLATARQGERICKIGPLATVIGSAMVVVAHAQHQTRDLTKTEIYQQGYDAGHHDGRHEAKPVIVPLCRCRSKTPKDKPRTAT